jgi:ArsR family transcriptional regulator, lead/cadmium/zinc/bismuth-responsive transcriptional repressor
MHTWKEKAMDEKEILDQLAEINKKIDYIIANMNAHDTIKGVDSLTLLHLPGHLQKTALALMQLAGKATAADISEKTGRERAVESSYLNQLVVMGLIKKERKGRNTFFIMDEVPAIGQK